MVLTEVQQVHLVCTFSIVDARKKIEALCDNGREVRNRHRHFVVCRSRELFDDARYADGSATLLQYSKVRLHYALRAT